MALMSLQNSSDVMASMILTRTDHLFIHNYIRSLLNIILRPILMVRTRLESGSYDLTYLPTEPHRQYTIIFIYTFINKIIIKYNIL